LFQTIRKNKKICLQVMIPLCLLVYLLQKMDYNQIVVADFHWGCLPLIIASMVGAYILRSLFYQMTFNDVAVSIPTLFLITGSYNFISSVLPFGLGHISYPYLLNKYYQVHVVQSVWSLILYNIVRIVLLLLVFIYAVLSLDFQPFFKWSYRNLFVAIAIALAILIIAVYKFENIRKRCLAGRAMKSARYFVFGFEENFKYQVIVLFLFYSCIVVGFNILNIYFYYLFIGYPLSILATCLIFSISNLSNLLPIHGIGRLGSTEAVNTLVLMALDFTRNEAIQISFTVHILQLVAQALVAVVCYVLLARRLGE